jgi:hypothetical protein
MSLGLIVLMSCVVVCPDVIRVDRTDVIRVDRTDVIRVDHTDVLCSCLT